MRNFYGLLFGGERPAVATARVFLKCESEKRRLEAARKTAADILLAISSKTDSTRSTGMPMPLSLISINLLAESIVIEILPSVIAPKIP